MKKILQFLLLTSCLLPVLVQGAASEESDVTSIHNNIFTAIENGDGAAIAQSLELARENNQLLEMLQSKNKAGFQPLQWAAKMGNVPFVKQLLEVIADTELDSAQLVNVKEENVRAPLHWAAKNGHIEIVRLLLEAGALPNVVDEFLKTPLEYAASGGNERVVQLLIRAHANVNMIANYSGYTALHAAADNGHEGVVRLLIEGGADVSSVCMSGQSALSFAAKRGYDGVVLLLIKAGADVNEEVLSYATPLFFEGKQREGIVSLLEHGIANKENLESLEDGWRPQLHEMLLRKLKAAIRTLLMLARTRGAELAEKDVAVGEDAPAYGDIVELEVGESVTMANQDCLLLEE